MAATVPSRRAEHPLWATAAFFTVALRLIYSALSALLGPRLTPDPRFVESNRFTENLIQPSQGLLYAWLGVWERFDTLCYIHIAQHGYDRPDMVVFPPLYPILVRITTAVTGQPLVAALLVSTLCAFFLFWGFLRLLRLDLPAEAANRAATFYAVWPASFIFFSGYPESLTIALMIWSIYFARTGRWWWSAVAGCFAGLAKTVGFLVIVPQAFLAWRERKWRAAAVALTLAGPAAFVLWLKLSGRMLPDQAYARYWLTEPAFPWITLSDSIRAAIAGQSIILRVHLVVVLLVAVLALSRNLRPEYTFYAALSLCFLLTKHSDPSQQQWTRYLLILFTAPVNLARWLGSGATFMGSVVALFLANVFFLWLFLGWVLAV